MPAGITLCRALEIALSFAAMGEANYWIGRTNIFAGTYIFLKTQNNIPVKHPNLKKLSFRIGMAIE